MGPCALVEVLVLPKGLSLPLLSQEGNEMSLSQMRWNPNLMFDFFYENTTSNGMIEKDVDDNFAEVDDSSLAEMSGMEHVDMLQSSFTSSVGGLQTQIQAIVRRVLDGRVVQPANEIRPAGEIIADSHEQRRKEAETLTALGLQPVRGLLLYGPPGCGKVSIRKL